MSKLGELVNRRRLLKLSGAAVAAGGMTVAAPSAVRSSSAPATSPFIILSCDGGGVRGLVTALLLQNLAPQFLRKVSLFAGTSTGSIIALGLAAGVPIGQIVRLFKAMANCKDIFAPNPVFLNREFAKTQATAMFLEEYLPKLASDDLTKFLTPILGEPLLRLGFSHYASTGLEALLKANLPDASVAQLAASKKKFVVVPSFQINGGDANPGARWRPVLFHNLPSVPKLPDLSRTSLVDTALSSAAAPLYFNPHNLKEGAFVDGGLAANNPCSAAIAAVLASSLAAPGGLTPKSIVAVSIGTGTVANRFPGPSTSSGLLGRSFGIFGWLNPAADGRAPAFPLLEAMFAGSNGINDLVASALLRGSTYIRVNPTFSGTSNWSLDDCAAIPDIIAQTQRYIVTAQWQSFARRINAI